MKGFIVLPQIESGGNQVEVKVRSASISVVGPAYDPDQEATHCQVVIESMFMQLACSQEELFKAMELAEAESQNPKIIIQRESRPDGLGPL